MIKQASK